MGNVGVEEKSATVIRLDYGELGSRALMSVIDGLPDTYVVPGRPAIAQVVGLTGGKANGPPASALLDEAEAVTGATGHWPVLYTSLVLAAWRGQEARALELMNAGIQDATAESRGKAVALAEYARSILYNGLGRYAAALAAARQACEDENLCPVPWAFGELVEAGARSKNTEIVATAVGRLIDRADLAASAYGRGILALSTALLADGEIAEASFFEAIDRFRGVGSTLRPARAQLLYGEWLRRAGRRVDARAQLRASEETFARAGADGFAERARRELVASGETARRRTVETRDDLTPQEAQIARFAADGQTNPEIGAQLFISPRTVEWHLRKIFQKLHVGSRRELRVALQTGQQGYAESSAANQGGDPSQ